MATGYVQPDEAWSYDSFRVCDVSSAGELPGPDEFAYRQDHLLVGWSGPGDDDVVRGAAHLASMCGARMTVVLVFERSLWTLLVRANSDTQVAVAAAERQLVVDLRRLVNDLPQELSITTVVRAGRPARVLVDVAQQYRCSAIISRQGRGTRSHSSLLRAVRRGHADHLRLLECVPAKVCGPVL